MHSVAKAWEVPIEELSTKPSLVVHEASGRKISYGEIIPFLSMPEEMPLFALEDLKSPAEFNLIGTPIPRTDIPEKVNGAAQFAMDIQLPGMLYGMVERGTVHGAQPTLKNEAEVLAMDGVHKVVKLDYGIGVIAHSLMAAMAAKKAMID